MKLEPFQLERYFAQYEFEVPWLLCASDCQSMSVGELLALEPGAEARLHELWLGYTEAAGAPELRAEIAGLYDSVSTDDVLVHAGAEEAIFGFMNVVLEPGDHVIVHAPYYQSLGAVARAIGAEVTEWRAHPGRGWALDLDELRASLRPGTRAVVINTPHNPTGWLADAAFFRALAALAAEHGFLVFSDEVYRGLEHDPADRLPAMADLDERAVSLGVLSKTWGLPGLRIGWIATRNAELLRELAGFKDYTTICNAAPSEFLATVALRNRDAIIERNVGIIRDNLDRLDAFFARHADRFDWQRPRAGPIAFPRLREGSAAEFSDRLMHAAGVLLLPSVLYDTADDAFRIGFGRQDFADGLEVLDRYVSGMVA